MIVNYVCMKFCPLNGIRLIFLEENGYSNQDIQKITGIKEDFNLSRRDVLALFKYQNHFVI